MIVTTCFGLLRPSSGFHPKVWWYLSFTPQDSAHHIPRPVTLNKHITNITDVEISPSWHNHTNPIKHYHHTFGWNPDDGRNRPKHAVTIIPYYPLTPNDPYRRRTAPLTSKDAFYIFIQQIYVLNTLDIVYNFSFFPLENAVCFIIITYLVPVLFTFLYIQGMLKLKK